MNPKYEQRVQDLEAEGMTRSDAQGIADAECPDFPHRTVKELTACEWCGVGRG